MIPFRLGFDAGSCPIKLESVDRILRGNPIAPLLPSHYRAFAGAKTRRVR